MGLLGPFISSCNFINTKRKGALSYSLAMAFEEAFKSREGHHALPSYISEWRPVNISLISLKLETHGRNFQTIIHSPAWMELLRILRGGESSSGRATNSLHWDLLSMTVSQIKPTLKPSNTYLLSVNSRRTQDSSLNSPDEVQNWMQLHRPNVNDDRDCGNLEFLCTLNTQSPERMQYLL